MPEYKNGKYIAVVESQGFDRTVNGSEYFGLVIRPTHYIVDGMQGGEREVVTNPYPRSVKFWLSSEKGIAFARKKLKSCVGWAGSSWSELSPETTNYVDFTGREINVVNHHQPGHTNPDKLYDNFDVELPREAKLTNDSTIPQRLDRLGGSVPGVPAPAAVPAAPEADILAMPAPLPPPPSTDEVPF